MTTLRHYDVVFGVPVQVQAKDEHDALRAAATLLWADPDFYMERVDLWEGDAEGRIEPEPPVT